MSGSQRNTKRPSVHLIDDLEQAKVLADPLRLKVLEPLCEQAMTTKQVATILGEKPTRLYHHIDALERVGLIRLVRTQQKRGTVEKYYRAIADSFRTSPGLFSSADSVDAGGWPTMGATVLKTAVEELHTLDPAAFVEDDESAMFIGVRAKVSAAAVAKLQGRLEQLLEEISDLDESEEADYRLAVALFPLRPTRKKPETG